mmetsp:Transcript_37947/g.94294  ORF Transcript_37947/g.94294 Transcript_37947/m.94294 type:complete len:281 (+) Transcript_37947:391-1233(+)
MRIRHALQKTDFSERLSGGDLGYRAVVLLHGEGAGGENVQMVHRVAFAEDGLVALQRVRARPADHQDEPDQLRTQGLHFFAARGALLFARARLLQLWAHAEAGFEVRLGELEDLDGRGAPHRHGALRVSREQRVLAEVLARMQPVEHLFRAVVPAPHHLHLAVEQAVEVPHRVALREDVRPRGQRLLDRVAHHPNVVAEGHAPALAVVPRRALQPRLQLRLRTAKALQHALQVRLGDVPLPLRVELPEGAREQIGGDHRLEERILPPEHRAQLLRLRLLS